jgi:shikimate dehydrogenase
VTARPGRLVLIGHPVAHSLSPRFQNAALRAAGIPLTYEALDVPPDALDGVLTALAAQSAAGNVTIPHKARVAERCHRLLPMAARTGAANTFWTEQGRLIGDNTDPDGFDDAVRALLGDLPRGELVGLVGAGGAAAGILAAMERWGDCRVRLYNRTAARARALAERFVTLVTVASSIREAMDGVALAVNATSVGMRDEALPFVLEDLAPEAAVVDLVYRPGGTALVRAARAQGRRAAGGLRMLVGQGARSFERWFGVPANRAVMWEAVRDQE